MKFSDHLKQNQEHAELLLNTRDYRQFLKSFFIIKKSLRRSYSYGVFALQAEVAKSLPRDIVMGEKNLTAKTLPRFLKAMELPDLVEDFFSELVLNQTHSSSYLSKLAHSFIENNFKKSFTDANFMDFNIPFLYAASGIVGEGGPVVELMKRTGLNKEATELSLKQMVALGLGEMSGDNFIPKISEIHINATTKDNEFYKFYQFCLGLQQEMISLKKQRETDLFYNEVFSVNEADLPALKEELKKTLKSFMLKSEDANGTSVQVLNVGFFKQEF